MEEKLIYEIKISVYESGRSRMEPVPKTHPEQVKNVLLQHAVLLERAITKGEILRMLEPKPAIHNLPTATDIMRTKQ